MSKPDVVIYTEAIMDSGVGAPIEDFGSGEFLTWKKVLQELGGERMVVTAKGLYVVEK